MKSITQQYAECPSCDWDGVTGDCDPGEDGDLLCPICSRRVIIEYPPDSAREYQ